MNTFKFDLLQKVAITISGEVGVIHSRCDSFECDDRYLVTYKSALGEAKEAWMSVNQLEAIEA
jgi:hypothetical protein